eukprot:scaffold31792_cov168-Amphora_coffeaeformis.AAC.17
MFKQAIVALLFSSAAASTLSAGSPKGRALLKHAKVIQSSQLLRRTEEQQQQGENGEWADYQNYQYEADYELDIAQMSIKYLGCSEWQTADNDWQENQYQQQMQYYYQNQEGQQQQQDGADGGEQEEQQQQQNYNAYNDGMVKSSMVRFTLCSSGCGSCSGEYAVDMLEFLDAYTEAQLDTLAYQCELIRERCYCQNGNWEQCFYDCYEQAEFDLYGSDVGVQYCLNEYYGKEAFELQTYLECAEVEKVEGNQANYNYNNNGGAYQYEQQQEDVQYYVGPYCADNKNIYLGAFYDEDCTYSAKNAKFSSQNYGGTFPYFKESIVKPNQCITCQETESYYQMKQAMKKQQYYQQQYQNNAQNANNQYYGGNGEANAYNGQNAYNYAWDEEIDYGDANEVCGGSFEDAIKCDESRGYNTGCNFIQKTLPSLDGRGTFSKVSSDVYEKLRRNKNSAIVMGVISALLLGALAFMCGLCGGGGDPKRLSLLEKRRMGLDEGQIA